MRSLAMVPWALSALLVLAAPGVCSALEVFATNIFSPDPVADEDPGLTGLMKVNLDTGVASTFIPDNPSTGFFLLTDVAVSPIDEMVYVTSQLGGLFRFDAVTGAPLPNEPGGLFRQLNGAGNGLLFGPDGTLYVAEISETGGSVAIFDTGGVRQPTGPTGLDFPAGMALLPNGDLAVATGGVGALGEVKVWDGAQVTTLIGQGALGGVVDLAILPATGDYDGSGQTGAEDGQAWAANYGLAGGSLTDGNGDGAVDAADYTVWRDNLGAEGRLLTTDFFANTVGSYAFDGTDRQTFIGQIPPEIPSELPPNADFGSNFPSEIIVSPRGTLLVSTLGLTRRPDNRGSILEYDLDGNLLGVLADGLPPVSGIALSPGIAIAATPEPAGVLLASLALFAVRRRAR